MHDRDDDFSFHIHIINNNNIAAKKRKEILIGGGNRIGSQKERK
jgi:hypothetical protein